MKVCIIAAVAINNVIGYEGKIPWKIKGDLARFRRITLGYPVIMGRKTYESIGAPLSGRRTIVLTSRVLEGVECFDSLNNALQSCSNCRVFIIGGEGVYREAMDFADELYITHVYQEPRGDTWFPKIENDWKEVRFEPHATHNYTDYVRS